MNIQEGQGWRLVLDEQRRPYGALIGGQDWAVELRRSELIALRRGVITLLKQYHQILPCLMPEEEIALDLDLTLAPPQAAELGPDRAAAAPAAEGQLFLALQGEGGRWALRFVLTPGDGARAVEGSWSVEASAPLAAALEQLPLGPPG